MSGGPIKAKAGQIPLRVPVHVCARVCVWFDLKRNQTTFRSAGTGIWVKGCIQRLCRRALPLRKNGREGMTNEDPPHGHPSRLSGRSASS